MEQMHFNPLAILAATVSAFVLGGVWYSPLLFARSWMQAAGLTEEQVKLVLEALGSGDHAYIASGRLFRLNDRGALVSRSSDAARPVAWPVGHEVRPARQSLGVNGCTDCHSAGSDFFFAEVRAEGPLLTESGVVRSRVSSMGFFKPYHKLFGLSFAGRPYFKIALLALAALIGSVLLVVVLSLVGRISGLTDKRG